MKIKNGVQMEQEIEQFYKRFNIEVEERENIKRFKNSLSKILENYIGNISLKNEFRDVFIKYTGIENKDSGTVDFNTEIDIGQKDWLDISGKNYIKFSDTCIGKAFKEALPNVIKYIQKSENILHINASILLCTLYCITFCQ